MLLVTSALVSTAAVTVSRMNRLDTSRTTLPLAEHTLSYVKPYDGKRATKAGNLFRQPTVALVLPRKPFQHAPRLRKRFGLRTVPTIYDDDQRQRTTGFFTRPAKVNSGNGSVTRHGRAIKQSLTEASSSSLVRPTVSTTFDTETILERYLLRNWFCILFACFLHIALSAGRISCFRAENV